MAADIVDVFCGGISTVSNKRGLFDETQEIFDLVLS
jgi:hypothetical protein